MPVYKISKGMRIILGNDVYRVVAVLPDGKVRLRSTNTNKYQSASEETILQAAVNQEIELSEAQGNHSRPKSHRRQRSTKQKPPRPAITIHRLDLAVRNSKQGEAEHAWLTCVMDTRTRCLLGFALVRQQELVLRLKELSQLPHAVEYDLFGDKTNLEPVVDGRKGGNDE
mgnify:CR=1 FL=1